VSYHEIEITRNYPASLGHKRELPLAPAMVRSLLWLHLAVDESAYRNIKPIDDAECISFIENLVFPAEMTIPDFRDRNSASAARMNTLAGGATIDRERLTLAHSKT
jgi:hypothetical protein